MIIITLLLLSLLLSPSLSARRSGFFVCASARADEMYNDNGNTTATTTTSTTTTTTTTTTTIATATVTATTATTVTTTTTTTTNDNNDTNNEHNDNEHDNHHDHITVTNRTKNDTPRRPQVFLKPANVSL